MWEFLRRINREGTTIVLTTHYIEEAERLCNRIGVIHEGKIVAMEPTESLIRKMSGDQVELYLKQELFEIPEEIRGIPIVLENEGRLLRFEEKGNTVTQVLKALQNRQIEIEKVDVRRPTLEDAFLKLIKKDNNTPKTMVL